MLASGGAITGALRLPPGAVDKTRGLRATVGSGSDLVVLQYTPTAFVDLYIAGFMFEIEGFTNTTRIIMQLNGVGQSDFHTFSIGHHKIFPPFPWKHVGNGSTEFKLTWTQFTGANQKASGYIWAWEEPKTP